MKNPHNLNEAMELAYRTDSDIADIQSGVLPVGSAVSDGAGNNIAETYVSNDKIGEIQDNIRQGFTEYIDSQMPTFRATMTEENYILTFKMMNKSGDEIYSTSIDLPLEELLTDNDVDDLWDSVKSPQQLADEQRLEEERLRAYMQALVEAEMRNIAAGKK